MADLTALISEAKGLDLFHPQGAFEVHCGHCQTRLDGYGDCPSCGLIGRPLLELKRRGAADPERIAKLLSGAIAKRRAYAPAKG